MATQLLEFQAKDLARRAGLRVPRGELAMGEGDAARIAASLGSRVVVKAQVPIGRRAPANLVVVCPTPEAGRVAATMLGREISGYAVESVLVEEFVQVEMEVYLAVTFDRRWGSPTLLFSTRGGTDVGSEASTVARVPISYLTGFHPWHMWAAAEQCGAPVELAAGLVDAARRAYELFTARRLDLVEFNPLGIDDAGEAVALDVRLVVPAGAGDGSLAERETDGFDLVELDSSGNVGLISTGAGASLLLVDLLIEAGLCPVNFCDIRTGGLRGSSLRLATALGVLKRYRHLACIVVNVFAGITDLSEFSRLFGEALRAEPAEVPIVARVEGENAAAARADLQASGVICVSEFDELISFAVGSVKSGRGGGCGLAL